MDLDELEQRIRRLEELERLRSQPWPDPGGAAASEIEVEVDEAAALWTRFDHDSDGDTASPPTAF